MDCPSTRTCPTVGVSNPAIRFSKVDLPQPLAPTSVTISLSCTARLTSSSAVTTESAVSNRFVTDAMLILPTERLPPVPGEQNVADENDKPVAQETKQANAEHRCDHNVVSVKQIRIVQQVAKPAPYGENLRNHHKHPSDPHRQPGAGHNRRQRCRKDYAREQLSFVGPHHHCGLIERDVELTDTMSGIDCRREKRTKPDQEHGWRISDAEKDQR